MEINCDICQKPLTEQGGLLFSPPINGLVKKTHYCVSCFKDALPPVTPPTVEGLREEIADLCFGKGEWLQYKHTPEVMVITPKGIDQILALVQQALSAGRRDERRLKIGELPKEIKAKADSIINLLGEK